MGMTIRLVSEINTYEESGFDRWDAPQGSEFKIVRVYEVLEDDRGIGFFKTSVTLNSYGGVDEAGDHPEIVNPKVVTKTTWE